MHRIIQWRRQHIARPRRVVVCGMNGDVISAAEKLDGAGSEVRVMGLLSCDPALAPSRWQRLGSCHELVELHHADTFDEVVFSFPQSSPLIASLSLKAARHGIPFRFLPEEGARPASTWAFPIRSPMGPVRQAIKRIIDIVIALIALAVSAPLFLLLAVLIPLDSPGSFIFRQRRVGKGGKEFIMYKFRTMHLDRCGYDPAPRSSDDARITRIGRLLRKTSLDEIPQFINVLRGEMSVVGPRPEMPSIVERYYTPLERARFVVKPGITGAWQLSPYRREHIHEHLYYDLFYIQHQSLTLDFLLMVQTIFFGWRGT